MDAQRVVLDGMMGAERDVPLARRSNRQLHFTDPGVCKFELAGVCPNQLFTNTRSDLGAFPLFSLFF
jgi:RNA-binding protein Luc7-like 2